MKQISIFLITAFTSICIQAQTLYFPPTSGNTWESISPESLNWCQTKIDSLYTYLDTNNTKAFILLKDGKIVLERYFGTQTQITPWPWNSAGKTITSFMTGIAQQEGYLNISDTTSNYLGEGWTSCTLAEEEKITIRHQLTMTSGLDDYASDPYCTLDTCLIYEADAGTRWAYHNGPYTLLDAVLEQATGLTLNAYTTEKLKIPTGMTGAFIPIGYNHVFFSNARSMARFGLLMLNHGNWNGNQIMTDSDYFEQLVNTSQELNEAYGYLWWLNGKPSFMMPGTQLVFNGFFNPSAPSDMYAAMGKDGQFLNVIPSENMVWLRMGNSPDGLPFPSLMNDRIWSHINDFECATTGVNELGNQGLSVKLFPNPAVDFLHLKSNEPMLSIEIFNSQGKRINIKPSQGFDLSLSVSDFSSGLYYMKVALLDGQVWIGKWIKE